MKRLLAAAVAVLLIGLAPQPARTQTAEGQPLGPVWARSIPAVQGLALSPEGARIVTLGGGEVRCLSDEGRTLWELRIPEADSAVVSRRGALTVVYTRGRPLARKVYFLGPEGRRLGILEPSEAVEDVAVSPDGQSAVLAAGRSVITCSVTPRGVTHRVLPLQGQPRQVLQGPGDTVYVSCREPAYVALLKANGKELWRREQPGVEAYAVSSSADGRSVALSAEQPGETIRTSLVTSRNVVRWTDVRPGRRPHLRLSAEGSAVALSYVLRVEGRLGPRYERRLTYLAQGAGGAWPKGGPFSAPLHVAIEPDGEWLVALDTQRRGGPPGFRLYGRSGERRWLYTAPQGIRIVRASQEGRHIAVYRTDGFLDLLRVAAG